MSLCKTKEIIVKTIANTIAVKKLSTENPGTILDAKKIIKASIIKVNKPSVSIVTGKARNDNIGFTKMFRADITKATINAT